MYAIRSYYEAEINQQTEAHVAGDTGKRIEVEDGHRSRRRLMRVAAKAAPKPLSILTTVTPLAEEVSMPSKADRPEKA